MWLLLEQLMWDDNRGVSPVIGVVLMVGLAVVISSVVAVAVFDIGDMEQIVESAKNVIDGSALQIQILVN